VLEHQCTVTRILEKFNESLDASRKQFTKGLDEAHYALKHVKDRTGALESVFKSVREDVDAVEVTVQSIRNENDFMAAVIDTGVTGLSVWIPTRSKSWSRTSKILRMMSTSIKLR
jgi:hypothetical protein